MKSDQNISSQAVESLSLEEALQRLHIQQDNQAELEMQLADLRRTNEDLKNRLRESAPPQNLSDAADGYGEACPQCKETNDILTAMIENMSDWIWAIDSNGQYTYCSPGVETFMGYTPDEMLGRTPFDFMPLEEAQRVRNLTSEIFRQKSRIQNLENWNIAKDGRQVLLLTNAVPLLDADGNLRGYRGIDRNITDSKLRENKLQSLSRAVQQSPVSIVITDTCGLIEFVNPKFTELTGYTPEEAIGQNPRILNAGQTPPEVFTELWRTITAGDIWQGEVLNKAKDGTLFWEFSSISPIYDENGVVTHYLAVKEDITEKKRLTNQLLIAKEQAEAATEAKSSFLATMSHEIRTPMNGVIGMTSLLLDTDLNVEQREYTQIVQKSAESLLTIINEILDFSKIEAGKLDLEMLDFDLRPTIEDVAELLAFRTADKGLDLICCIDPDVPSYLRGDPGRLRQIITNLVGNAIKFTHQGEIVIRVSLASDLDGVATIRFEISDTGIGVPQESIFAIFTPFSQADASTTRNYGGTGLGLAICKQLTELMGGEIGAVSESGKGSTFWFTAPFDKQASQVTREDITTLRADISGVRVLVVTSSVINASLLSSMLNQWNCYCETAPDGECAITLLHQAADRKEPFRLVLMDERLSKMDGRELGSRIKGDPRLASTLMVMLTAAGQRGDAAALKQIGFDGYLVKPMRQKQVRDCIELALGRNAENQESDSPRQPKGIITRHTIAELNKEHVRILLAEDNIINQKVAQAMLNKLGYKTDVVADGREAVRALGLIDYNLVFMDCMMPEMDGFEATRTIRNPDSRVYNHDVTIVALTANAMKNDREACLAVGMNDYMSKPVNKERMTEMLEKWLVQSDAAELTEKISDDQPEVPMLFDEAEMLNNFDGDRDFAESILEDVLQALPGELQTLAELCEGDDAMAVSHQAHTIKGLAANISAPALREICYSIETTAHDGDLEGARKLMPELERTVSMTSEAIISRNKS